MRMFFAIIVLLTCTTTAMCQQFVDGTVIVWENGGYLDIVQRHTNSTLTHVGIVLYDGAQGYVYESSTPDVHRYTLTQYEKYVKDTRKENPKLKIHFLPPSRPYTKLELDSMKKYAIGSLGRKFGLRSYITGRPQSTLHCCEYVGNILYSSGRYKTLGPKENPKTIYEGASRL